MNRIVGYFVTLWSLIFLYFVTQYFIAKQGSHNFPNSFEEFVCEGIAMIIFAMGILIAKEEK